jgi:hypothetical protein
MFSLWTALRTRSSVVKPLLWPTIALHLLTGVAMAQTDPARITGTVRDASGGTIAGVLITVVNERTGDTRTMTSASEGRYFVSGLSPSRYTVQTSRSGFAPMERKGVQLLSGQELTLDFELQVAAQSENVTVTSEPPLLDVGSASMGANVNER